MLLVRRTFIRFIYKIVLWIVSLVFYLFCNDFFMYVVPQWQSILEYRSPKRLTKVLLFSQFMRRRLFSNNKSYILPRKGVQHAASASNLFFILILYRPTVYKCRPLKNTSRRNDTALIFRCFLVQSKRAPTKKCELIHKILR